MTAALLDERTTRLRRRLRAALGSTIYETMNCPSTHDIMVNPDGRVWVDSRVKGMHSTDELYSRTRRAEIIALVADAEGIASDWQLSADMPDTGERFEALLPPVVEAPCFTIRKHSESILGPDAWKANLDAPNSTCSQGTRSVRRALPEFKRADVVGFLLACTAAKHGLGIAGATGSGKTTLLNTLARSIPDSERTLSIEDRREVHLEQPNTVQMLARPEIGATMVELVRKTLRHRPDRLLVGEARDGATLQEALKAAGTGHGGILLSIHSDSAEGTLRRMERLLAEVSSAPQKDLIADAISLIVYLENKTIREVLKVQGCDANCFSIERL